MKHYLLLATLLIFSISCKNKEETKTVPQETVSTEITDVNEAPATIPKTETTIFYLIRHAEEIRTNPNDKNPILNVEGINRARNLATYFERNRIDNLYVTKYLPTRQTVTPISQQKMLKKVYYNPDRFDPKKFMEENKGKTALVVGQKNEIPKIVNSLIGEEKYQEIADLDYATLYKVTIQDNYKNVEILTMQ